MYYLTPVETIGNKRTPKYVKSWNNRNGLPGEWSFKDFGSLSQIGLLSYDGVLSFPDVYEMPVTWTQRDRGNLTSYLAQGGVEDRGWITGGGDWRNGLQRLAGMSQAMQSAHDDKNSDAVKQDPSRWLGREVHFGASKLGAVDSEMFRNEQAAIAEARRVIVGDWEIIGREWHNHKTGQRVPVIAGGALPYTNVFTGTDGTALTTHSPTITYNNAGSGGGFVINTNAVAPDTSGGDTAAHVNSDTFSNEQYAQATVAAVTSGHYMGVAVRCASGNTSTWYGFYSDSADGSYLFKEVAYVWTQIGSTGAVFTATDVLKLEVSGTTLTPKVDAATLSPPGAQTDSAISSGYAGICGYGASISARLDSFEGGNLAGATAVKDMIGSGIIPFAR